MAPRCNPILHWRHRSARMRAPRAWQPSAVVIAVLLAGSALAQTPPQPPLAVPLSAAPPAVQEGIGAAERLLPLEVTVNGSKQGSWVLLERLGVLHAPVDALEEWRVQPRADTQGVMHKGTTYLPLSAVPGFSARVNFANQSLDLTFSPQAFAATRLTTEVAKRPVVNAVLPSFFANYDLSYTALAARDEGTTNDLGLLTELGASGPWGILTSSHAGRSLLGDIGGSRRGWTRLETTYTRDMPETNRTLRLGDSSTRAGMWGRTVYFGGVQLGTNYGLTPGFITQASPVLSGASAAPSTVELYVNDVLRQVSNVPSGPFVIDNYAALTGGGEARLVVRDVLGRETVITQSFFTSSQLLAKGLNDWSAEAGRLRLDLGNASNRYGDSFASASWRHGFSGELTLEGRAELTRTSRSLGFGFVAALPWQMLGKAAVARSSGNDLGDGHLWLLGVERQTLSTGAYLQAQGASIDFRQLGQGRTTLPTKLQVAGNFSYSPSPRIGTFGMGFASLHRFDAERVLTFSGNYSRRIGVHSSLTFSFSRVVGSGGGGSVGVNLVVPLDGNRVVTASATRRSNQLDAYATASRHADFDGGLGWRVLGGRQSARGRAEGNLYYLGRYGRLTGDLSATRQQTALRLGAAGGLVMADGHLFASRRLDDSFALVEVAGYGNVGIGLGSNMLSRTNDAGIALIPRLMAYQTNSIRVDPADLPISAELDSIEQTAVPAYRSGVKVVFPVRSGRGALVKLVFDDGEPAPAGAVVQIEGEKEEFYVARRGESFVTGLQTTNRLRLSWKGKQCQFEVTLPPVSDDEIARLGPLSCKGVAR
jgi:outer membrane usher protein